MKLKKRQKLILQAIRRLGGTATLEQISQETGFNVNGISQSCSAMYISGRHVKYVGGLNRHAKWKIVHRKIEDSAQLSLFTEEELRG